MRVPYEIYKKELDLLRQQVHTINDNFSVHALMTEGVRLKFMVGSTYIASEEECSEYGQQVKEAYKLVKDFKYAGYIIT